MTVGELLDVLKDHYNYYDEVWIGGADIKRVILKNGVVILEDDIYEYAYPKEVTVLWPAPKNS